MKVVFLDFDGVLNSTGYTRTIDPDKFGGLSIEWWAEGLDPEAVARLNTLLERTGAKVVISSSWRINSPLTALQVLLRMRGFEGTSISKTELLSGAERCEEIQEWLDRHPEVTSYVILDDNTDAEIEGHFIHTDMRVGLTDADVEEAIEILGKLS